MTDQADNLDPWRHLDPWDQQPGETPNQYRHFLAYRDLGPGRTVRDAAERVGRKRSWLYDLSRDHRWVVRAQAWDRHTEERFQREMVHSRQLTAEAQLKIAGELLKKATTALGKLDPEKLAPADLVRFVDVATKVQRAALGDVVFDPSRVVGQDLTDPQIDNLSPDEAADLIDRAYRELGKRARAVRAAATPDAGDDDG